MLFREVIEPRFTGRRRRVRGIMKARPPTTACDGHLAMVTGTGSPASVTEVIPDVQATVDTRRIPIDKVGVKIGAYPITLKCPLTGGLQHTVASVNMYVGLPHFQKGTHMSRFLELLNAHHDQLKSHSLFQLWFV